MENAEYRDWQKDWELIEALMPIGEHNRTVSNGLNALRYWLNRVQELEEENRRLKVVAEAVKKCLSGRIPWCEPCYREKICDQEPEEKCAVYQLKKILAALEEVKD